jgi:hypothetical protein
MHISTTDARNLFISDINIVNVVFIYHIRFCDTEILRVLNKATYITKSPFYRTYNHGSCHWSVIK